jgi:hypothetical protein
MKNILKYLLVGFIFGIVLTKSKPFLGIAFMKCSVSILSHVWHYRCSHFTGVIGIQIIKRNNIRHKRQRHSNSDKEKGSARYWFGIDLDGLGFSRFLSRTNLYFIRAGFGLYWLFFWSTLGTYLWIIEK